MRLRYEMDRHGWAARDGRPAARETSADAQTTPAMTLNGEEINPETVGLAPDRSRNHPVLATLGLRPRSAPEVRTSRGWFWRRVWDLPRDGKDKLDVFDVP